MLLLLLALSASHAESPTPASASGDVAEEVELPLESILGPIRGDKLFKTADVAVQVVDARTGEEVWSYGADTGLNPASTTKVLTAATALRTLGPSYTFTTRLFAAQSPDGAGAIQGSLYLRGGGDPTLVVEKLWKLARDLELAGVTEVKGDLVLDESFFGPDHRLPGWNKRYDIERGPSYFPALSALSLNFNTVAVVVRPGPESGKPAVVTLETDAGSYVKLTSTMTTGTPGSRPFVGMDREVTATQTSFLMEGSVPVGDRVRKYYRTVGDPTRYLGEAFKALLAERGIEVRGKVVLGEVPEGAETLATLSSPPLTSILMDMNKFSSNFMAEQVLRTVAAESRQEGTTEIGLEVMREYLSSIGADLDGFVVKNGSGLSRGTSVAPSVLTAVLLDMASDPRVGHEFAASLAIAGQDGTLRRRLTEAPARLRGKTGTLDGVHCLAGYLEGAGGEMYAFAFLVNGHRGGSARVKRLHDDFARRMFAGPPEPSTADADPTP